MSELETQLRRVGELLDAASERHAARHEREPRDDRRAPVDARPAPVGWSRHRWLSMAAAVVAVVLIATVVALTGSSPDRGRDRRQQPVTIPTTPEQLFTCGTQLPVALRIPDGYAGPVAGPSADGGPVGPGQLVLSWATATGAIEARWPADQTVIDTYLTRPARAPSTTAPPTTSDGRISGGGISSGTQRTAGGGFSGLSAYRFQNFAPAGTAPECETLQVSVFDADEARLASIRERLARRLFVPQDPLVASVVDVAVAPTAAACQVPAGARPSPNVGGAVSANGPFATPSDALRVFLEDRLSLMDTGYVEMHLPDGSIAFGVRGARDAWVTVVHVTRVGDAWTVDSWNASGC